jgi:hypothetical protein
MTLEPVSFQLNLGIQAFGMSITLGAAALNAPNYWVTRYAQFVGGAVENRAVSGSGLPTMVYQGECLRTLQRAHQDSVSLDGPLNDVRQAGAAMLPSVKPALDALISSLFSGYFRGAAWPCPGCPHRERGPIWAPAMGADPAFSPRTPPCKRLPPAHP